MAFVLGDHCCREIIGNPLYPWIMTWVYPAFVNKILVSGDYGICSSGFIVPGDYCCGTLPGEYRLNILTSQYSNNKTISRYTERKSPRTAHVDRSSGRDISTPVSIQLLVNNELSIRKQNLNINISRYHDLKSPRIALWDWSPETINPNTSERKFHKPKFQYMFTESTCRKSSL